MANNAWESFQGHINDANEIILEILNNEPMGHWLDKVIHNMIWHEGDCVVRWVCENKELVAKINVAKSIEEFEVLRIELDQSVRKLNRLKNR